jgi:putative oxygen-independent coproporphyrinogen III oxidase
MIALYVHWPFCRARCPYCDFNVHVRKSVDQDAWRAALLAELDHAADEAGARELQSIFFGGGTPSLMPPETVAAVIGRAMRHWRAATDMEITMEANPNDRDTFPAFADAGVNRLSLGVQALDDESLRALGRDHNRTDAIAAIEDARRIFPTASFDLIYARPGQTLDAWRAELREALALAGTQLSLYQLTFEPGTVFEARRKRGEIVPPSGDKTGALYEIAQDMTAEAGLPAYEISNHARAGRPCRHNLTYWRYGDYAGIGPGAHGRVSVDGRKFATTRLRAPERWLESVRAQGHGTASREAIDANARKTEMLLMGLRLVEGVRRERFRVETGEDFESALDARALAALIEEGFLALDEGHLAATAAGRQRLDAVRARRLA